MTAPERELVLCTNGPGELYTWAGPLLRAVRELLPGQRVVLSLLPCPFASGQELRVARELGFDAVTTVAEYLAFAAGGPRPRAYQPGPGLVLGLGGDAMHAVRVARRLGRPVWRYSFEPYWNKGLDRLFVPDERTASRSSAPAERKTVVGNLVADALSAESPPPKRPGLDVLVLAGSRRFEAVHMLGVFAAAAELIAREVQGVRFHWPRSRLLTPDAYAEALSARRVLDLGGAPLRDEGASLVTPGGTRLRVVPEEERYSLMRSADLALTIPGTNTLELGIAGAPSIVSLPLQKAGLIPVEGPAQYVTMIPGLGPWLKARVARAVVGRMPFVALPNMVAGELIQPELRGDVTPQMIAAEAVRLLSDEGERERIRARLAETMPRPGAAARLAGEIAAALA